MPLPSDYNAAEHLQDTIKQTYNSEVREWFLDVTADELDISTSRASLRTACTHQEGDTMQMTVSRQLLFDLVIKGRMEPTIVGESDNSNYQVLRRTKPIVKLLFLEDLQDIEPGYRPVEGTISFRLMNQTTATLSKSEATTLGNKIKSLFGTGGGFIWKKGRVMCSYSDWEKGYQLQLLVRSEAEGRRIVEQVLDIQSHSPDWEFFTTAENASPTEAFPTIPPREVILGKSQRLPRRRPIADVRFQSAVIKVAGLPRPVCLYDRSGRFREPLTSR